MVPTQHVSSVSSLELSPPAAAGTPPAYRVLTNMSASFPALSLLPCPPSVRPPGSRFEEGDVLQPRPVPEALHPAWKTQHLPLAASPRPGETLRGGLQHSQPTVEHRGACPHTLYPDILMFSDYIFCIYTVAVCSEIGVQWVNM